MRFKPFISTVLGIGAFSFSAVSAGEVYSGEPLGEALFDLARSAVIVSHELSSASPLMRTDVFRLSDGRLIAVTSRARKLGQPYTIETLRVTPSATDKLTKRLPTMGSVRISK